MTLKSAGDVIYSNHQITCSLSERDLEFKHSCDRAISGQRESRRGCPIGGPPSTPCSKLPACLPFSVTSEDHYSFISSFFLECRATWLQGHAWVALLVDTASAKGCTP